MQADCPGHPATGQGPATAMPIPVAGHPLLTGGAICATAVGSPS
ncbi:hypothetical protein SDC9_184936 [bioreactor metagenome]|uniref:Uncharacterized protein n=1 Tax=bioreactor metagenome TaxID=1076179 RepID=A0A645HEF5_9ZZZZ